jgi:hypothetical protein
MTFKCKAAITQVLPDGETITVDWRYHALRCRDREVLLGTLNKATGKYDWEYDNIKNTFGLEPCNRLAALDKDLAVRL